MNSMVLNIRRQFVLIRYKRWTRKRLAVAVFVFSTALFVSISLYHTLFTMELLPGRPYVDKWCEREDVPDYMVQPAPDEMTVITMFLNLGVFKKGEGVYYYHSPYKYYRWMRTWGRMVNRVVAYMEDDDDIEYFRKVRACLPESLTKIIKVRRDQLPAFKHLQAITKVYNKPSYPKLYPDTVYPEYSCTMHAKFDVLHSACKADFYQTPYFAWVDIGLFRQLDQNSQPLFKLVPPDKFNPERVGVSQITPLDPNVPPEVIMRDTLKWVSGAMVLATKEYMMKFISVYKETVNDLLKEGLSNSDQSVIYAMYTTKRRKVDQVKIKTYLCHNGQLGLFDSDSRYFCLGYVCKNAWEKRVP